MIGRGNKYVKTLHNLSRMMMFFFVGFVGFSSPLTVERALVWTIVIASTRDKFPIQNFDYLYKFY